ncbi:MAG: Gfo/Idh/MocA family oxidoreductase [bacterium]
MTHPSVSASHLQTDRRASPHRIRTAVIGVGYLGRYHAQKYAAMEGVELAGVVDKDAERAAAVAGALGTRAFRSPEEVYPLIDAASVAVPTTEHYAVARGLLAHRIDVLIEKPMASTLREASELVRLARRNGRILQVGHLERFNAAWKAAQGVLESPRFIEAHRLGPFQERGTDVDVVLDLMIHDIDIVLKFVRTPLLKVDSVGVPVLSNNVDIANARLYFRDGTVANLTASRVSLKRTRKIRFFQPDAYLSVDYDAREVQIFRRKVRPEGGAPEITGEQHKITDSDALHDELAAFVSSVRSREPPEVGGAEGRRALEVALRILRRMRSS